MRRRHRATHYRIWVILAALLPALLIGTLALRRNGPSETMPTELSEVPS
jgi:hypothetical protein